MISKDNSISIFNTNEFKNYLNLFDSYEIVLSNDKNIKFLFTSFNLDKKNYIKNYILKYISDLEILDLYNFKKINDILSIFDFLDSSYFHFGEDKISNRYKIYVTLYNLDFLKSLNIINKIRNILGIDTLYNIEPDFIKFDCLGFDLSNNIICMKIYELVNPLNNFSGLPNYINKDDVKEIGYLKTFTGRRKKFFRFSNYYDISLFKNDFEFPLKYNEKNFESNQFLLIGKVKYYCLEGEKKEIYFI